MTRRQGVPASRTGNGWRCTVAALTVLLGLLAPAYSLGAPAAEPKGRSWLALGDSYSSGEGIPWPNIDKGHGGEDCQRADGTGRGGTAKAWPVVAYDQIKKAGGFTSMDFVACTGNITDDWEGQVKEAVERGGRRSWDVISLSFGGNNILFKQILLGCLDIEAKRLWTDFDFPPGCDVKLPALKDRIDLLTGKATLPGKGFKGTVTLPDLYDDLADLVRPGGQIIVAGYPQLIEQEDMWGWQASNCQGIWGYDVKLLRDGAKYLNDETEKVVNAADKRWASSGINITFVDVARNVYETSRTDTEDRHGLCSNKGQQWLNGLTSSIENGGWRPARSFHPTQEGHTAIGKFVAEHSVVERLRKPPPSVNGWR
jgi:hypothetical protein